MQTATNSGADLYKAEWDAFIAIREEFAGHFDRYAAFRDGEDNGNIKTPAEGKTVSIVRLAEKTKLEYELTPSLRERFASLDAYRTYCWTREFGHR